MPSARALAQKGGRGCRDPQGTSAQGGRGQGRQGRCASSYSARQSDVRSARLTRSPPRPRASRLTCGQLAQPAGDVFIALGSRYRARPDSLCAFRRRAPYLGVRQCSVPDASSRCLVGRRGPAGTPLRSIFGDCHGADTAGASVAQPTVGVFAAVWVPNDPRARHHLRPAPYSRAPWAEVQNAILCRWPARVSAE